MMIFTLNKADKKPLYQQVIETIESGILSGQLLPGEKLPSERDMSQFFNVNRSTIVRAMEELHDRNIVVRRVGSGTYVNTQKWGTFTEPRMYWNQQISQTPFQKKVQYDLANGDLPVSLYPSLHLPEIDWQLLLEAEQEHNAMRLGTQRLRATVQRYLREEHHWQVGLDEILITAGTQQAISLITLGLLKTGDSIAIENPSYFYSLSIFQALGIRIYGIPMDQNGIMIDKLDALVHKHSIRTVFVNPVFHNPTGRVMSQKRKRELIDYCQRKHILIVEDDAYGQLKFHDGLDNTPLKMHDHNHNSLYLGSLSKYLGRSIRIGWMIAPKSIIEHLAGIRQQLDSGLSSLPQFMAEFYLDHYAKAQEAKLKSALKNQASALSNWLKLNFSDLLSFTEPQGGFHLYARLLDPKCHKVAEERFQQLSVRATPSTIFGEDHAYRLCFAHFGITKAPENQETEG